MELDSYDDRNYYCVSQDAQELVVKFHNGVETANVMFIQAQMNALKHLRKDNVICPEDLSSGFLWENPANCCKHFVRMLKFIPGKLLYERIMTAQDESDRLKIYYLFGKFLGKVDSSLFHFQDIATIRIFAWNIQNFLGLEKLSLNYLPNPEKRQIVSEIFQEFKACNFSNLRTSVIQNDANDRNVVVMKNDIFAIIDFGDLVFTWTVCELSIALAYIIVTFFTNNSVETEDYIWLERCYKTVQGYLEVFPLNEQETKVVYLFIKVRLATSASIGAYSSRKDPNNEYLLIHSEPAWRAIRAIQRVGEQNFTYWIFNPCTKNQL